MISKPVNPIITARPAWPTYVFLSFFVLLFFGSSAEAGTIIRGPAYLGLNSGLVGCWNFDGRYAKAQDCSGNNNTGTLTNEPNKAKGKLGQALIFNGAAGNDHVVIGNESNFDFEHSNSFTISGWIKRTGTSHDTIVSKIGLAAGYRFRACGGFTSLCAFITGTSGSPQIQVTTQNGSMSSREWHHVVMTYNGNGLASGVHIYQDTADMQLTVVEDDLAGNSILNDEPVVIGVDTWDEVNSNSLIDEVRIYRRVLSHAEIARLYRIGLGSTVNQGATADPLDQGLVGHWTFDGTDISGTRAKDRSGFNNHGTLTNGPLPGKGKIGQALSFDGVDDYVEVANHDSLRVGNKSLTLSAWVYNTANEFGSKTVFAKGLNNVFDYGLRIDNDGGGGISYLGLDATGANTLSHATGTGPKYNQWQHLVITKTGTTITLYADSVLAGTLTITPNDGTDVFSIGSPGGQGQFFKSKIDDVRVYSRALSAGEINRLYNQTQSKFNSSESSGSIDRGLVGHWTFDGGDMGYSGTRAKDISGNNNHGTLTNGPRAAKGKVGQALSFDGVNDYINVSGAAAAIATGNVTMSAWIKTSAVVTGDTVTVIGLGDNPSTNDMGIQKEASGVLRFAVVGDGNCYNAISPAPMLANTWYHVVGTFSTTDGLVLYVNGVSVVTHPGNDRGPTAASMLAIGAGNPEGLNEFWPGLIDDVRVYNRALSAGEIQKLYQMGR